MKRLRFGQDLILERAATCDKRFTVYVQRLGTATCSISLAKFTKPEHSLNLANNISLTTPEYCRNQECDDVGLTDNQEATIIIDRPGKILMLKSEATGKDHPIELYPTSVKVTHNSGWMLCTSEIISNKAEFQKTKDYFAQDGKYSFSMLSSQKINQFAFYLGLNFGRYGLERIPELYEKLHKENIETKNAITVTHGKVKYAEEKDKLLLQYEHKDGSRALMSHFVKRKVRFEVEREYRFFIQGWGMPKKEQVFLPVSPDMRRLFGITASNLDYLFRSQK